MPVAEARGILGKEFKSQEGEEEDKKDSEGEQAPRFRERKEFKPRREGEFKPRREGDFKPRRDGESRPRREGDFKPRREGGESIVKQEDLDKVREAKESCTIEFFMGSPDDEASLFLYNGIMEVLQEYVDDGTLVCRSGKLTFDENSIMDQDVDKGFI